MFQELKSVKQANILIGDDDDKEGLSPGYLLVLLEQHMNNLTYNGAPLDFWLASDSISSTIFCVYFLCFLNLCLHQIFTHC